VEHLRQAIESHPVELPLGTITLTCSFGVSCARPGVYDLERLVHEADDALYRAKETGKNRLSCAGELAWSESAELDHASR
jgi:diguanylate cyclase (GGDEF)-like protein